MFKLAEGSLPATTKVALFHTEATAVLLSHRLPRSSSTAGSSHLLPLRYRIPFAAVAQSTGHLVLLRGGSCRHTQGHTGENVNAMGKSAKSEIKKVCPQPFSLTKQGKLWGMIIDVFREVCFEGKEKSNSQNCSSLLQQVRLQGTFWGFFLKRKVPFRLFVL